MYEKPQMKVVKSRSSLSMLFLSDEERRADIAVDEGLALWKFTMPLTKLN